MRFIRLALFMVALTYPPALLAQDEPTAAPTTAPTEEVEAAPATQPTAGLSALGVPVIEERHVRIVLSVAGAEAETLSLEYALEGPSERSGTLEVHRGAEAGTYMLEIDLDHDVEPCDATWIRLTNPETGESAYFALDYSWEYGC